MLKKDYIQRQFEEFGKMLGLILGYKHDKDWEKFEQEIADAALKFSAIEINAAENISHEDFVATIVGNPDLTQQQKTILATLLFEKMNYYIVVDNKERYLDLKNKCLGLYRHLHENFTENEFNLDVHYKLNYLNSIED